MSKNIKLLLKRDNSKPVVLAQSDLIKGNQSLYKVDAQNAYVNITSVGFKVTL